MTWRGRKRKKNKRRRENQIWRIETMRTKRKARLNQSAKETDTEGDECKSNKGNLPPVVQFTSSEFFASPSVTNYLNIKTKNTETHT
jgi:uncharacterized Zn finger protein